MTNTILEGLVNFNTERKLNEQEFNLRISSMNILEELLEIHGIHDNDDRMITSELYRDLKDIVNNTKMFNEKMFTEPTENDIVDGFCDIQVYAFGEPFKMGYNPIQCLGETSREIHSRTGSIINGKFVKDKSKEARAKWYKADFIKAKL